MSHPEQGTAYQQQGYQGGKAPVPAQQQVPAATGIAMKRRNPAAVWIGLPIITFGIYGLVWFYKVHAELYAYDRRTGDAATNALLSMIFGAITLFIWPLVMYIKLGGRIRQAQQAAGLQPSYSTGLGLLLSILGFGMLYKQIELNKIVDRYSGVQPGQQVSLAA